MGKFAVCRVTQKTFLIVLLCLFSLDVLTYSNFSGFVQLTDLHADNFPWYDVTIHLATRKRKDEYASICLHVNECCGSPEPLMAINRILKLRHFMSPEHRAMLVC